MIITEKTTSEDELNFLLAQMDGWSVEDELQIETTAGGFQCRFEFPGGDPRADKLLQYLETNAAAWQPVKGPWEGPTATLGRT